MKKKKLLNEIGNSIHPTTHRDVLVMTTASTLDDVLLVSSSAKNAPVVAFDVRTGAILRHYGRNNGAGGGALCALGVDKLLVLCPDKRSMDAYGIDKESMERSSILPERPSCVASSRDGVYAACGSSSGSASVWEASSGRLLARFKAHFKGVSAMMFTADGSALITGGEDGAVHAWRMSEVLDDERAAHGATRATAWRSWTEHSLGVTGIATGSLSGAGGDVCVVSCSADRTCKIYSLGSGSTLRQVRCPTALSCCALDACEATLYAGGVDGRLFEIPLNGAPSVAVSLDGSGSADARDGMVALEGHSKKLVSVECSTDGAAVITASEDGTARVWDAASRQTLQILRHPKAPICATAMISRSRFSGEGRGDRGAEKRRAKSSPAPTFSKFLIGPNDRSGIKPWQGAPTTLTGTVAEHKRPRRAVTSTTTTSTSTSTNAPQSEDVAALRDALTAARADADAARADAEEWRKLHGDLKIIVDRQLVDAE